MENIIPDSQLSEKIDENLSTKKEILELILKFLYENNYLESAKLLEQKTNLTYHQNEMQQLKALLVAKRYNEAIEYLTQNQNFEQLQKVEALHLIIKRQYLEILRNYFTSENGVKNDDALSFLRNNISPIIPSDQLNRYSCLLFIKDKKTLEENLKLNFEEIINDDIFINKIQSLVCLYTNSDGNKFLHNTQLESLMKTYEEISNSNYNYLNPRYYYKQIALIENFTPNKESSLPGSDIDEIWHLKFTKSNKYFAICLRNGIISIFNVNYLTEDKKLNIKCISCFEAHTKYITCINWSQNEKYLVTSSNDKTVKLWNPFEGKLLQTFKSHTDIVSCAQFFLGDDKIISGGIDKKMVITSIATGKPTDTEQFSRIRQILVSESLKYIIILPASLNDITIYDYTSNSVVDSIEELDPIISAEISRYDKGKFLLTNVSKVNANINLYNIQTKELINKYYGHKQGEYIIQCAFGGRMDEYIICGSEEASIFIWHRNSSIPIHEIKGHTGVVNACCQVYFDGCEKGLVFSVSDDHTLRIWADEKQKIQCEYKNEVKAKTDDDKPNGIFLVSELGNNNNANNNEVSESMSIEGEQEEQSNSEENFNESNMESEV